MAAPPTTYELEATAGMLVAFHLRRIEHWSTAMFSSSLPVSRRGADLLDFVARAGIVAFVDDGWTLTPQGQDVIADITTGRWSTFGLAALRTGLFDEQLSRLLEVGLVRDGLISVPMSRLRRTAPVAGTILAWDPSNRQASELVVPLTYLESLLTISAMDQAAEIPSWVLDANGVGWRAELYSLRLERTRFGIENVLHTSRDVGDGFGYDIETTARAPSRLVEVKGSRSRQPTFVLTAHELSVARANPDRYEIQFWGTIALDRPPHDEYDALIRDGYPQVYRNVAEAIDSGTWRAEPRSWKVSVNA